MTKPFFKTIKQNREIRPPWEDTSDDDRTLLWQANMIVQSALNTHIECRFSPCVDRAACMGGPRGTCRKTDGFPACTEEGKRRLALVENKAQKQGQMSNHERIEALLAATQNLKRSL